MGEDVKIQEAWIYFLTRRKSMKKIISLILVLTLILSAFTLAGCSGDGQADENAITAVSYTHLTESRRLLRNRGL